MDKTPPNLDAALSITRTPLLRRVVYNLKHNGEPLISITQLFSLSENNEHTTVAPAPTEIASIRLLRRYYHHPTITPFYNTTLNP